MTAVLILLAFIVILLLVIIIMVLISLRWSTELIKSPEPNELSSPADYGLPFTEVLFPSRDDRLTLHGWFIPAQGVSAFSLGDDDWTTGSKGTVVFGHGRFGSKDPDLIYAPFLREAGYNCFLFDFRGHGRSEGDYTSFGFHERKDLLGAIDFLRSKGVSSVGVMGFSLGAVVAIGTAAMCERIVAVIADGAFVELRTTLARGARERGFAAWLIPRLGPFVLWLAGRRVGGNLEEAEPMRWVDKIAPRALFIIHGGRDRYIPTDDVRRLYDKAGEPKELWIASQAEHRQVDEEHPEEYRKRVLAFFDRHLVARSQEEAR
jgi:pimeloyl-ACP methyl ester carboxylesterase